ncbi:hypothetical protein [Haloarcula sp. 1CSR25-25]|jgi:hypothetical protein|uniref:hypothetical protein n=1 Tax=Haloarcula sp. 1CSR25-25 TaxID=2862545 RepID=UPI002895E0B7|nr:hypothetical protein [Haloarcula sp. 1CSR25-25]MDT3437877.1 hypothetical protein [Haloarcula sp. 1CSR25-25]
MSLPSQTIVEDGIIPFSGLSPRDGEVKIPRVVAEELDLPRYPEASLKEIIESLPSAERRTVEIDNSFVAGNGIVATDEVKSLIESDDSMGSGLKEFNDTNTGDPFDAGRQEPTQRAHDARAIVDPRREALAALGYNVSYHWQIGSDGYTVINPTDWYYKCHQTLEKHGEREPIGWVEFSDFGGAVDLYVLLPSQRFIPPTMEEGDEDRGPVYLGYHSGYRFDGTRSLDFELFGFDTEHQTAYWALGKSKSQPHRGDVMQYAKDWWEKGYEDITSATSVDGDLLETVDDASTLKLDFSNEDTWDPAEFIEHLGLPPTYAEEIADRAQQISAEPDVLSMWNLFVNISAVINEKYTGEGKSRNSMTFQGHARVGRKLLRDPETEINRAKRKYDEATDGDEDVEESQRTLSESIDDIDGVIQSESEMSTHEKLTVTQQIQDTLG